MKDFSTISRIGRSAIAAPLAVLLMSGTAQAALTADQVWQSWKNAAALAGLTVSAATEAKDGGSLMLNGVTVAPEGLPGLTISDIVLAEQADGSVLITPGADIGMDYAGPNGDTAMVDVAHEGLTLTAREDAGALVYAYAASVLTIDFDSKFEVPAATADAAALQGVNLGKISFDDLAGTYSDTPGANRAFGMALTTSKLSYEIVGDDPDMAVKTTSVSSTADVALEFNVVMAQTVSLMALQSATDFQKALQEGLSLSGRTKQGVSTGTSGQESDFMSYQMAMTAQPGEATFAFSKDGFAMDSSSAGLVIDFSSPMMPVPVKVTSGPVVANIASPVMAGDVAGDYALKMQLTDLAVNEEAWAIVDPVGVFKRDPANLLIDVSGKAKIDFLAMAMAEESGAVPPVPAPETLNITSVALSIAGAALAGSGAFTFDNATGMPMPVGEANVSLTGGNMLIDGLIATGMMSDEDAMGPRMMMGMFFAPGAEPDSLTSKIEAKAGGEILVNGQRIQ